MDLVTFGETALRLAPRGRERLETADAFTVGVSGPESNAAVAARRLGAEVAWASRLPESPLGRRVAHELRGYDLDVRVAWTEGRQGLTFSERGGRPRGDDRVDDRDDAALAGVADEELPLDLVRGAGGVYVTGATAAVSTEAAVATARLLKAGSDDGGLTAFGLEYRPERWDEAGEARETLTEFFPAVDVFLASEGDVRAVLDRDGEPAEMAHALAAEWGFGTVVLTRERTAVAWRDSTVHEYPLLEVDEVDAAGAGDAFAGAFLAGLLDGREVSAALKRAVAASALARTVPGAVPAVTREEVERVAETVGEG